MHALYFSITDKVYFSLVSLVNKKDPGVPLRKISDKDAESPFSHVQYIEGKGLVGITKKPDESGKYGEIIIEAAGKPAETEIIPVSGALLKGMKLGDKDINPNLTYSIQRPKGGIDPKGWTILEEKAPAGKKSDKAEFSPSVITDINEMLRKVDWLGEKDNYKEFTGTIGGDYMRTNTETGQPLELPGLFKLGDTNKVAQGQKYVKEIESGLFLENIQRMQGFGALSNAEGTKIDSAISALRLAAPGEDSWKQATAELNVYLLRAKAAAQHIANGATLTAADYAKIQEELPMPASDQYLDSGSSMTEQIYKPGTNSSGYGNTTSFSSNASQYLQ